MSVITAIPKKSQENTVSAGPSWLRENIESPLQMDQPQDLYAGKTRSATIYRPFIDYEPISSLGKTLIGEAFEFIANAADTDLYEAERSNNFDYWKDSLVMLSRKVEHFTNNHRKILGSLIPTTKDKDISDFLHNDGLKVFQDATNNLRRPRIAKVECSRVLSNILKLKANTVLPLYVDENSQKADELDELLQKLIEKSNYGQK